jgi:Fic family protein
MTIKPNVGKARKSPKAKSKPNREVQLRRLLDRKSGATLPQIQAASSWQPHTARAAISRLRKTGVKIERQLGSKGLVYRAVSVEARQ